MKEKIRPTLPGGIMLILLLLVGLAGLFMLIMAIKAGAETRENVAGPIILSILVVGLTLYALAGLFAVQPNLGVVLLLFGRYMGTVNKPGLHWVNPLFEKKRVSQRVRNFETKSLKVNDHDGNPIEIAAVVVWKVVDTAEATFSVDNYDNYVAIQSEAALRNMAIAYSYDSHEDGKMSLRANAAEIATHLREEIHDRLKVAGVEAIEARLSHLAYAPEIAGAMLQRQQASAIVAARTKIVEGAVGMVHLALEALAEKGVVTLDEERKAAMVSNLLVVLCGERGAQPVLNTGTIYH